MKMMRRMISFMLAFVLMTAMTITAFAAGTGSITVENPQPGQTYYAYKIFDVVYNTEKNAYSYTIDASSEWLTVVQNYAAKQNSGLTLTKASSQNLYVVTIDETKFSAGLFSSDLRDNVEGKTGTELLIADGVAVAENLDLGYYFVTSTSGALCNLTTTNPDVTIRDKNDIVFEKEADDVSVELGQTVNFTLTGNVPDTTGCIAYTYEMSDTMSDGLTFNKDVKVMIGTSDVTAACTISYTDSGFTLSIPVLDYQDQVGETITVTYSADVNENAVANVENNTAYLYYTNNPNGSATSTPGQIVKVYSAEIVIDKYDTSDESTKLAGAEFVLYKTQANGSGAATVLYYKLDNGTVSWVTDQANATVVTTDENGAAKFEGLEDGKYYLKEIKAPDGYNLLGTDVEITIAGSTAGTNLSYVAGVANNTGTILPETGGMGTIVIYLVGTGMMIGAAVLVVLRRRMSK